MAGVNLPNVEGMTSLSDLKNAVGKMTKELSWLLNNLDTRNLNYVDGDLLVEGTVTALKLQVEELSAISANLGKIVSGEIYGAYIATKEAAYPRAEMSSTSDLFGAYKDADNFIRIVADYGGSPALEVWSAGAIKGRINTLLGVLAVEGYSGITVSSYSSTDLRSAEYVLVPKSDWSGLIKEDGLSLQDEFDTLSDELAGKATVGISTSLSGSANGGIPIGTVLMVSGGGTVTWTGVPLHSHAQN
jgi:hypothetical protein